MKFKKLLLSAAIAAAFVACSKDETAPEGGNNSGEILGTYDFVGMNVTSKSTATDNSSTDKTITYSTYNSKENQGTVVFDASKVVSSNFTYKIDTTVKAEIYTEGEEMQTIEMPFMFTVPVSGSTAAYKMKGTDSIYFEQGFISLPDNSGTAPTTPNTAKVTWAGDTLILHSAIAYTSSQQASGITFITVMTATQDVKLKKRK